jgi:hypothetical protein
VYLFFRRKGQRNQAGYVVTARTDSRGRFSASFVAGTARGRYIFAALFDGSKQDLWSLSRQVTVAFNGGAIQAAMRPGGLMSGPGLRVRPVPRHYAPVQ